MPESVVTLTVQLEFDDPKAHRALRKLARVLDDLHEDFSYRDDIRQAVNAALYAYKHIKPRFSVKK